MDEFDNPKDKKELFQILTTARDELDHALNQLTDAQFTAPGADGWTIKDHLTHVTVWEQGLVALLSKKPRAAAMGLNREEWSNSETDAKNALIYERNRHRALADVRAAFHDSYQQLLAALNRLDDAELFKPYSYYDPDEPGKDNGRPILDWIAGNTYGHYAEHAEWIQQMRKPN